MNDLTDAEIAEMDAEHVAELKESLSNLINGDRNLGTAYPFEIEGDIYYEGPLAALLEFFQENRSELEELQ